MTNRERLFGKELSNLLDQQSFIHKNRNPNRYNLKARGISVDDMKKNVHKKIFPQVSKNQTVIQKPSE